MRIASQKPAQEHRERPAESDLDEELSDPVDTGLDGHEDSYTVDAYTEAGAIEKTRDRFVFSPWFDPPNTATGAPAPQRRFPHRSHKQCGRTGDRFGSTLL